MLDLARELTDGHDIIGTFILALLIFFRCIFAIYFTPFFGGRNIIPQVKVATCLAMTLFLLPALASSLPGPIPKDPMVVVLLFIKEGFMGLVIALIVSMIFFGIQSAGQFIDNQRGISQAAIFNPALGAQVSLSGNFLFQLALVMFFILGGHRLYITAFFRSYEILPVILFPQIYGSWADPTLQTLVLFSAKVISIAIQLAAPVMIALFLSEMVLGIANRVAPQMDVLFISYTLKAIVGLLMMLVALELMLDQSETLIGMVMKAVTQMINTWPPPPN